MPKTRSRPKIVRTIQAELAPFPGRLSGSLRDTLGCIIALVLAMTLRVPGISLAMALLFLLQRERPGLSLRSSLNIFGGAALACVASLLWVQVTDGTDVARFLGLILGIFLAAFGMSATTFPLLFTIFGFYGFVDLSSWDAHRHSDAIVTSSLYNLASLAIVLLSAVAVEYLFGTRHPADELKLEMQKRLTTLSRFFHTLADEERRDQPAQLRLLQNSIVQYAHADDRHLNKLYNRLRDANSDVTQVAEINPQVIALREEFHIPPDSARFGVFQMEGAEFVAANPGAFDVLMVDAFDLDGQPPHLCSVEFYRACYEALTPDRYLVVNFCHEGKAKAISRIEHVFNRSVYCLRDCDGLNLIAIVGKEEGGGAFLPSLPGRARTLEMTHPLFFREMAHSLLAGSKARFVPRGIL